MGDLVMDRDDNIKIDLKEI